MVRATSEGSGAASRRRGPVPRLPRPNGTGPAIHGQSASRRQLPDASGRARHAGTGLRRRGLEQSAADSGFEAAKDLGLEMVGGGEFEQAAAEARRGRVAELFLPGGAQGGLSSERSPSGGRRAIGLTCRFGQEPAVAALRLARATAF